MTDTRRALTDAIARGDEPALRRIARDFGDACFREPDPKTGREPLQSAEHHGRMRLAPTLLELGADADTSLHAYCSVLHYAASQDDLDLLRRVLQSTTSRGRRLNPGHLNQALQLYATHGEPEGIRLLVAAGADPNATGGMLRRPLSSVIGRSHAACAKVLLELGAEAAADPADAKAVIPLHAASAAFNEELADLLLSHRAPVHATDLFGDTALHALMRAMIRDQAFTLGPPPTVERALRVGRRLIEAGAAVDARAGPAGTPLLVCVNAGFRLGAEFLLEHGADPHAGPPVAPSPIQLASQCGLSELIESTLARRREEGVRADNHRRDGHREGTEGAPTL